MRWKISKEYQQILKVGLQRFLVGKNMQNYSVFPKLGSLALAAATAAGACASFSILQWVQGGGSYGGFLKGETTNMKLYTIDLAWSNGWYLKNLTSHIANPFLGTLYSEHNLVKPVPRKTLSFRLISMFIVGSETDEVQRNTPIMMVQDGLRIFQRRISPEITSKTCYGQPVGFPSYSEKRMFESTTPSTPCEFKVPKRSMQAKSR